MTRATRQTTRKFIAIGGPILILLLLAVRLPSLVEPAGGDQSLYSYVGERILVGGVPYIDAWDQKPPAIHFIYASLWRVWPHESVVAGADLVAAAAIAWLLGLIGRRMFSDEVGYGAAVVFLLLGNPSLQQRLSGVYVRGQCETFIALMVTAAIAILVAPARQASSGRSERRTSNGARLVFAGVFIGIAFWLKYNAAAYGLVVAVATMSWPALSERSESKGPAGPVGPDGPVTLFESLRTLLLIGAGFLLIAAAFLGYFASHHALHDLWLATISYNLQYSGETYTGLMTGARSVIGYPFQLALERTQHDPIWFIGGLGSLLLAAVLVISVIRRRTDRAALIALAWMIACIASIMINGARNLPQYFIQANPALALAGAAGLAAAMGWIQSQRRGLTLALHTALVLAVAVAVWRVATFPKLVDNMRFDARYAIGGMSRETYLSHFAETKYKAWPVAALAAHLKATTRPTDSVLVFGFNSGGVYVQAERRSASRFFWSRPVIIEFAADNDDYGSRGLLQDLQRDPPAAVALQRQDWGVPSADTGRAIDPNSADFFMNNVPLRTWLETNYVPDMTTPDFDVWRRK